ncbi:unnamed protein product [Cylicostephanus goldi]|uniref:Uncharacterized protein n=1 Tax=Cylicostephanus goldi TaxID=71465 RepID=A0A3P6R1U8_CYLGO|nr:unnamed protein product [Cylicostephanus goldi]
MGRIQGVVLITGANRGLGLEMTRSLLAMPDVCRVYAGCRHEETPEKLRNSNDPKKKLRIVELDVSKGLSVTYASTLIKRFYFFEDNFFNILKIYIIF